MSKKTISADGYSSIFVIDDVVLSNKIKTIIKDHEKEKQLRDGEDTPPKPPKPKRVIKNK